MKTSGVRQEVSAYWCKRIGEEAGARDARVRRGGEEAVVEEGAFEREVHRRVEEVPREDYLDLEGGVLREDGAGDGVGAEEDAEDDGDGGDGDGGDDLGRLCCGGHGFEVCLQDSTGVDVFISECRVENVGVYNDAKRGS